MHKYLIIILIILFIIGLSYIVYNFKEGFENKVKLSLLAQMKNETMNLKVWIDHYLWQGVEKIYLIDNGSTDEPLKILKQYIDKGIVFYVSLPEKHKQVEHYKFIDKLKSNSMIDCLHFAKTMFSEDYKLFLKSHIFPNNILRQHNRLLY